MTNQRNQIENIKKLKGPIVIFGAGGFIGVNLLQRILKIRDDVIGVSSSPDKSWRLKTAKIPEKNIVAGDLLNKDSIEKIVRKIKPKTIFNLAAYGSYSKQKEIEKIYQTNFLATVNLIQILKKFGFKSYLQAGSQSEYGLNSCRPMETDELIPNSHYAVSKAACNYLIKYYGKIERLPVVHLRFYSVYGPWEEPDRLMPTLIKYIKEKQLPPFVDPQISRDFIYIDDVVVAMILLAAKLTAKNYGEAFNIATGKKTTIRELALLAKKIFKIKAEPVFSTMKNRDWDLKDWWGNPDKIKKEFNWKANTSLKKGLIKFFNYEKNNS